MSQWIITYSGKSFDFENLSPDNVCLEDIAHGLAYTCRFNGQCHRYYSVARHSLNMALWAQGSGWDTILVKQCLLHDASEAYMGDMVSPLKALMPEYKAFEKKVQGMIYTKYGLPEETHPDVKQLDLEILVAEKLKLFPTNYPRWELEDTINPLQMALFETSSPVSVGDKYSHVVRLDGLHQNHDEDIDHTETDFLNAARRLFK